MTWNGALLEPMRKEIESWLPPLLGCTAKAASQEILAPLEVGEEADDLGEVTLSWSSVVRASHDHSELSLEPELSLQRIMPASFW